MALRPAVRRSCVRQSWLDCSASRRGRDRRKMRNAGGARAIGMDSRGARRRRGCPTERRSGRTSRFTGKVNPSGRQRPGGLFPELHVGRRVCPAPVEGRLSGVHRPRSFRHPPPPPSWRRQSRRHRWQGRCQCSRGTQRRRGTPRHRERAPRRHPPMPRRSMPTPRRKMPMPRSDMPTPRRKMPMPRSDMPTPRGKMPMPRRRTPTPRRSMPRPFHCWRGYFDGERHPGSPWTSHGGRRLSPPRHRGRRRRTERRISPRAASACCTMPHRADARGDEEQRRRGTCRGAQG